MLRSCAKVLIDYYKAFTKFYHNFQDIDVVPNFPRIARDKKYKLEEDKVLCNGSSEPLLKRNGRSQKIRSSQPYKLKVS